MTLGGKRIGHYGKPEEPFTVAFDVIAVKQSQTPLRHGRPEPEFAVDQGQVSQILAVEPQQIESVKPWFATPEQQVFELGLAMAVESDDFAVEHRGPGTDFSGKAFRPRRE
jgi:hypothetical protein